MSLAPEVDRTKLLAARFRAATDRPYLATALYALTFVPTGLVPTLAVDARWRCYVGPEFVARNEVPALAGALIHEVSHLLRAHFERAERLAEPAHPLLVNIAQDCEINDDLVADELVLPAGALLPATFELPEGRMFEEYVRSIRAELERQSGSGAGGFGDNELPQRLAERYGFDIGAPPDCGATPGGRGWEAEAGRDTPAVHPAEAAALRKTTAEAVRAHDRTAGSVPEGWRRWADHTLEPVVDWRIKLGGGLREAISWAGGAVDYTRRRPARRGAAVPEVVLPALARPLPRVAVVIDTSASMGADDLAVAFAEITGILRGVGLGAERVTVLTCDAAVHTVRRITRIEEIELRGGGGTDLTIGIEAALRLPHRPQVIVVLTDGYTDWPTAAPGARVIAVLIGESPPAPPAWIESVEIETRSG
ncbi:vWA domain-containing protein [Nocardia inohanensis]|uniref:vWA domain-containing protein n=1 Tax=Nocardia inohanensis TaxID=209246 RepID=UPI00082A4F05|nr:VWA-like domain-containing protein [Nocardia inohanensis]